MLRYLIAYAAVAVAFFGLDFAWLSTVGATFYKSRLGSLMLERPNYVVAAAFYLFYVGGVVFFAVAPALSAGSWLVALGTGALLGFIAYGTYDLTNLSTLRDWPAAVSFLDMAWGTFLTAIAAVFGYFITRLFD